MKRGQKILYNLKKNVEVLMVLVPDLGLDLGGGSSWQSLLGCDDLSKVEQGASSVEVKGHNEHQTNHDEKDGIIWARWLTETLTWYTRLHDE